MIAAEAQPAGLGCSVPRAHHEQRRSVLCTAGWEARSVSTPPGLEPAGCVSATCSDEQRLQCVTPPGLRSRRVLSAACSEEQRLQCVTPPWLREPAGVSAACSVEQRLQCATPPWLRSRRVWVPLALSSSVCSLIR